MKNLTRIFEEVLRESFCKAGSQADLVIKKLKKDHPDFLHKTIKHIKSDVSYGLNK